MGHVMVQDYYKPSAANAYKRGYVLISYMMTPITYGNLSGDMYGAEYKQFLMDYPYTAAWWAHAEGLPSDDNAVTLDPDVKDARGLPVARLTYEWGANDIALAGAARDKAAEMMAASGARKVRVGLNYGAHAMGSCRMGDDPSTSVVDQFCQSHDVPNLYICDTSVFVTGSGLNPTLTAMAIAQRAAERIVDAARGGNEYDSDPALQKAALAALLGNGNCSRRRPRCAGAAVVDAAGKIAAKVDAGVNAAVYLAGLEVADRLGRDEFDLPRRPTRRRRKVDVLIGRIKVEVPGFYK